MKRQQDIQRILEDFKGVRNTEESNLQRRKGLPMSLENSTKKFDDNEQDESEQEIGENENERSTDVHNNSTDDENPRDHD